MVLSLLGGITLRVGERVLDISNRKAKALVGYLALAPGHVETRQKLAGLLWNENDEAKARASLRQALVALRDLCGDGFVRLICTRNDVRLNSGVLSCDVDDVLASVALGDLDPLLLERKQLADMLMAGFEDVDPSFGIWLNGRRQSLASRIVRGLELRLQDERPEAPFAIEQAATALRNLDPTDERAARTLMSRRVAAGDVGGALAIYKSLWDLLDEQFDTEPSQQTQELVAQIKLMQPIEPAARSVGAPQPAQGCNLLERFPGMLPLNMVEAPKLVISIDVFDVEAVSAEQRRLIKIFRQDLIASLVRFREWIIRDDGLGGDVSGGGATGGEYAVNVVAEEVPTGVHLGLTLRETRSGTVQWGDRYLVSRENWYETQQAIVRRLATALNIYLSAGRLASIETRPVNDLKTNDLWLLGQMTFQHFDAPNWDKAAGLFRQVIAQMPSFAPAYSSLAQLNNTYHMVMPGMFRDGQRTSEALACAREAARLDPVDSRSLLCLAWSHAMAKQHDQAVIFAASAHDLNKSDLWTMVSAAGCLAICGENQRAQQIAEHALQLPLAPNPLQWAYYVSIRFMGSDYAGAVQAATAAGNISYVPAYKAAALYHMGERALGVEELANFVGVTRARWIGAREPSDENILCWLLSMIPIKRPEDWERVRHGLAGLGAPVARLAHNAW